MTQDDPVKLSIQTKTQIDLNKQHNSDNYEILDNTIKERIMNVITDSKDILLRYKSSSYVYPNWLNLKRNIQLQVTHTKPYDFSEYDFAESNDELLDSSMIMREIGFYIMTRVIDSRFMVIPEYRSSVNNPFHRALWHIAHYFDFNRILSLDATNYSLLDNDSMYKKFFSLLDTFCIMSRVKTVDEFKTGFHRIYRNITSSNHEDHNITIPMWIYNKYSTMIVPPIYIKYPYLSELSLMYLIGADEYYKLLCKEMAIVPRCIKIKDVVSSNPLQIITTYDEQNLSAIDPCIVFAKKYDTPDESIKTNCKHEIQNVNIIKHNKYYNLNNIKSIADTSSNWRRIQ